MKIALFGGSFNPIHAGHLKLSHAVLEELHYQKVIFMPTFISPFKIEDKEMASPIDRLKMVQMAIEDEEGCECSSYEIEKEAPSFTINTVQHLYSIYENNSREKIEGKLGLIIGSDQLRQFKKWKDYKKILELCELIVARRRQEMKTGTLDESLNEENEISEDNEAFEEIDFKFTLLKASITAISSTTIRSTIRKEKNWKEQLTAEILNEKVAAHMEEKALYDSTFWSGF